MTPAVWLVLGALALTGAAPRSGDRVRLRELVGAGRLRDRRQRAAHRALADRSWRGAPVVAGVAVAAGILACASASPVWAGALAVLAATGRSLGRTAGARRRSAAAEAGLRSGVRALAAELDAGGRPAQALTAAARAAPAHAGILETAARAAEGGDDPADVLLDAGSTRGIGAAWRVAGAAGSPLAGVLARVADDLDAAADQRRRIGVAVAGPRASAAVLAGLPVLGLGLATAMGAEPLRFLLGTRAGAVIGAVGVVLDAAGLWWIERIVGRAAAG